MTPEREARLRSVANRRQSDLTIVLENVHDPHNIGAVLRTADAVGLREIFVLFTESHLEEARLHLGGKSAAGALRWLDIHFYTDPVSCFEHVKKGGRKVYSTRLGKRSISLYDLNLYEPVALLFGNEHDGVSEEAESFSDGNFIIPQMGMVQSLNISVACAVTLFEALRQREKRGLYNHTPSTPSEEQEALFKQYRKRHEEKYKGGEYENLDS